MRRSRSSVRWSGWADQRPMVSQRRYGSAAGVPAAVTELAVKAPDLPSDLTIVGNGLARSSS